VWEKQDGLCNVVVFYNPTDLPQTVDIPAPWGLESSWIIDDEAACDALPDTPPEPHAATGASGSVAWEGDPYPPCEIDVDLLVAFPPGEPWVPADNTIVAADLAVDNCG
jgi:hypothetical protein